MTQAELAEFLKDAFDGVIWRDRNLEPQGSTTLEKFKRMMVKHGLGKLSADNPVSSVFKQQPLPPQSVFLTPAGTPVRDEVDVRLDDPRLD